MFQKEHFLVSWFLILFKEFDTYDEFVSHDFQERKSN